MEDYYYSHDHTAVQSTTRRTDGRKWIYQIWKIRLAYTRIRTAQKYKTRLTKFNVLDVIAHEMRRTLLQALPLAQGRALLHVGALSLHQITHMNLTYWRRPRKRYAEDGMSPALTKKRIWCDDRGKKERKK